MRRRRNHAEELRRVPRYAIVDDGDSDWIDLVNHMSL